MKPAALALVALLVGLIAGVFVGMELAPAAAAPGPATRGPEPARRSSAPAEERGKADELVPVTVAATSPDAEAEIQARAEALASAALARTTVPTLGDDLTRVIVGKVVDEEGSPIAGADVVCRNAPVVRRNTYRRSTGGSWQGLGSAEDAVASAARRTLESHARTRHAKTAADGTFRLERIEAGFQSVEAYAEGFHFQAVEVAEEREAVLKGTRVLDVVVDVRLPDGTQPEHAVVHYSIQKANASTSSSADWTPEQPSLVFPGEPVEATFVSGEGESGRRGQFLWQYESSPVTFSSDSATAEAKRVDLHAKQILIVEVTGPASRMQYGSFDLKYVRGTDTDGVDWSNFRGSKLRHEYDPDVEDHVRFVGSDIAAGSYTLAMVDKAAATPQLHVIEVGAGLTRIELELAERDLGDVLRIEFVTPLGEPVTGAHVSSRHILERAGTRGSHGGGSGVPGEAPGEVLLPWSAILGDRGFETGDRVLLTARTDRVASLQATLTTKPATYRWVVGEPTKLTVSVAAEDPASYAVRLTEETADSATTRSEALAREVGPGGTVEYTTLLPGRYGVELWPADARPRSGRSGMFPAAREVMDVGPSGAAVTLTPLSLHDVVITGPGVTRRTMIVFAPVQSSGPQDSLRIIVETEGRHVLRNVPAGTYELTAGYEMPPVIVQVPGGEVVFDPPPIDSVRIGTVRADSPAAAAGLREGDVIVAFDGKPIAGIASAGMLQMSLMAQGALLTVRRGDREVELRVEPPADGKGAPLDAGMEFLPAASGR